MKFDWYTATPEEQRAEAERRNALREQGHATLGERMVKNGHAVRVPVIDDGVRCIVLPWSMLCSDNNRVAPATRKVGAGGERKAVFLLTQEFRNAKSAGREKAMRDVHELPPLDGRIEFTARLYEPNRTSHRDIQNFAKLAADVCSGIAYTDDKQIDRALWYREPPDIDAPRLVLTVRKL